MTVAFLRACRAIEAAERAVRLIARVQPANLVQERSRLKAAWVSGRPASPDFVYSEHENLLPCRRALERVAVASFDGGMRWLLLQEKAAELALDAELAEARGSSDFMRIAARRYPSPTGELALNCGQFVRQWCRVGKEQHSKSTVQSDDSSSPCSLVSVIQRTVSAARLPLAVSVAPRLLSTAAVSERAVLIRPSVALSREGAQRIALHELLGHALPRQHGLLDDEPLLRVGTAGAGEDEEGRALVLEERHGFMGAERRQELAWRHAVALAVRSGADWTDALKQLFCWGASIDGAIDIALRAFRGGGLGRELVYLPAWLRVRKAIREDRRIERWFERGRVSVAAALALQRHEESIEPSRTRFGDDIAGVILSTILRSSD